MKSLQYCCAALVLPLALLWFLPLARAQRPGGDETQPPRCTDLSGKIPLPCPASNEQGMDIAAPVDQSATPAPRAVGDSHREHREAGNSSVPPGSSSARPAAEQPRAAAVRTTAVSQPSTGAVDPRAAIGLHPRTPPEPAPEPAPVAESSPASRLSRSPEMSVFRNLLQDQKDIWTSPLRLRLNDMQWLAPLLAAGTVSVLSDTDIQRHLPTSSRLQSRSKSYSTYGVAAFAGASGAAWLWGHATHNDHLRETGILSGEAVLDSLALTYAIKSAAHRDRPYQGNGHGTFFSNGDSFPSEHAVAAWSMATVIAHEYPGPFTKLFAYGGAAAVSAMRVTGRQHFTSDALVGSAIGYFVGRHVYNAHHDREDMKRYGTFEPAPQPERTGMANHKGSAYVPIDSWVYGAFDRLSALGFVETAFAGLRPWTRLECVRLLDEAGGHLLSAEAPDVEQALRIYRSLQAEFALDSAAIAGGRKVSADLESVYTRFIGISGRPLNDSFHFGQSIINDYGRPYQEGANAITGFTSRATAGPLAVFVSGEYQHAPSSAPYSFNVRNEIANADSNPVQPDAPFAAVDRFRFLDTYVALNLDNNQVSFGRQTLWWGPGQGGALMFTNNAEPMTMLRLSRVSPLTLPSIFRYLGPVRTEMFIGRLDGHRFPSHPYITGQKFSFKPTPNLELGFSKITLFAGGNTPLTWHNFYKATFSVSGNGPNADLPGIDAGDRRASFDFRYRIPGLRNWLTIYNDSLSDDDPSPLAAPRRAAMNPGIYLSHVPGLPKLDFRVEAAYTDVPADRGNGGQFIYWNTSYHDSHTNSGNIMGSWVGRKGRGLQFFSTYWFSPQNTLQLGYRDARVAGDFLEGGMLKDVLGRASVALRPDLHLTGSLQFEWWDFPLLSSSQQHNAAASIQITYRPKLRTP